MEKVLNETSVRTANNFGINDIKIDLQQPEIKEFENSMIISDEIDKLDISISDSISNDFVPNRIGLEIPKNYGIDITVPKGTNIKNAVLLNFEFDEDNMTLIDEIKINLEENSSANFIIKYSSNNCENSNCKKYKNCSKVSEISSDYESQSNFHFLKQTIHAKENSKSKIVIANLLNEKSNSFIAIENELEENANIEHTLIEFGGSTRVSNYYSKMQGNFSQNDIKTVYLGKHNDILDINYNIEEYGRKTKCNINVQGALAGNSHKNFKGIIDFKQGSKESKGFENENCTLLSNTAKSKSLPVLLCHEEDVEGQHGVASGKIDESKLFYIMTKGISYEDAKKLIVKANFNEIIKSINNEELENEITQIIDEL